MAKRANNGSGKLGSLEMRILIKPRDGSEPTETTTTPSMWANVDQWLDSLLWDEPHTQAWVERKLLQGIYMLAAQSEDLMRPGEVTLGRIADFINLYEVELLDDEGEAGDDPNGEAPAGEA
ncbi:MAG: hypothetical protein IJ087_11775 [Eggerthellaceae bacterium]|nr:hypothetical protein [Eggerthellaceae bacterium]